MSYNYQNEPPTYRVRYFVEEWNKPVPQEDMGGKISEGIRMSKSNYGYTDTLLLVSIVENEGAASVMLLDTSTRGQPSLHNARLAHQAILAYAQKKIKEDSEGERWS